MPGWHERTLELQKRDRLQVIGIIQEQHPDRCRLFMQWKRMDWPILVDSLDLLGVSAVPIALLVDEHGIIRKARARAGDLEAFLGSTYPEPPGRAAPPGLPAVESLAARLSPGSAGVDDPAAWVEFGDALFLRGRSGDLDRSIAAYRRAIVLEGPPEARFRLGVALRRRHESPRRQPGDFQACLEAWGTALERRPNQYIWRRRIQQYGPRLMKPYAFYDWVAEARRDIKSRGEEPARLAVEPGGAEIAYPSKSFAAATGTAREPDPEGRIHRDPGLIRVETATAPSRVRRGGSARVHLTLRPAEKPDAYWNNESEELLVWVRPPPGLEVDRRRLTARNPDGEKSKEPRNLEFEVHVTEQVRPAGDGDGSPATITLPAYALYYVCEGETGTCRYLRQDFAITLKLE